MIFSHYLQRLKQEDYDKPPKITDDSAEKTEDKGNRSQ